MVLQSDIQLAFESQRGLLGLSNDVVKRTVNDKFESTGQHIEVITGIRRSGKSTLLKQLTARFGNIAYFNFEDSRIHGFELNDFQKLDTVIGGGIEAYFFDEIQNVPSWEVFVRQLHDRGEKIFVTGSNASLLSSELGTRLTGRHIRHELFPFSYPEFLSLKNSENHSGAFGQYLTEGGFPEYLKTGNPEVLQNLLYDIVYRDIAIRHGIRNSGSLMDLTLYLVSNLGKEMSYNNLRKMFQFGSANTVSDYLSWLADSYLFYYLPRFSWSARNISVNPRKIYVVDNGIATANTLSFTGDSGRLLENAAYMFLRQQPVAVYYFREKYECDFVVFEKKKCRFAIQVCESLNHDNLKRETAGLLEAMKYFSLQQGYILTRDQDDEIKTNQGIIHVMPLYRFITQSNRLTIQG